jgi:hypothetical protein
MADASTIRNPVLQWLIYGHLWLALAVVAQIQWTGLFLHEAPDLWRYSIAAALGTFAGYATMRLARVRGPEVERYPNLSWYRTNRVLITVLVGLSAIAAFVMMWPLWSILWKWLLPVVALAFFYVTPFTAASGRSVGLRSIPFLKVLLIPVLWVVVVVANPIRLDLEAHSPLTIATFACMRIPLILALAIAFDIRDTATDDPALRTVPLVFGLRGAKSIALFLLICSALFEVIFLRGLGYATASWTVLFGYTVAALLIVRAKPVRDPIYYALYVDGVMILIPLCVWVGTML